MRTIIAVLAMAALAYHVNGVMKAELHGKQEAEAAYGPQLAELSAEHEDMRDRIAELNRMHHRDTADFLEALSLSQSLHVNRKNH